MLWPSKFEIQFATTIALLRMFFFLFIFVYSDSPAEADSICIFISEVIKWESYSSCLWSMSIYLNSIFTSFLLHLLPSFSSNSFLSIFKSSTFIILAGANYWDLGLLTWLVLSSSNVEPFIKWFIFLSSLLIFCSIYFYINLECLVYASIICTYWVINCFDCSSMSDSIFLLI